MTGCPSLASVASGVHDRIRSLTVKFSNVAPTSSAAADAMVAGHGVVVIESIGGGPEEPCAESRTTSETAMIASTSAAPEIARSRRVVRRRMAEGTWRNVALSDSVVKRLARQLSQFARVYP